MAAPKIKDTIITAFVLDFETGGLNCQNDAATQLSIHAVRIDTFEVMETFNHYIYPYYKQSVVKKKVLKNKYDKEEPKLMNYGQVALEYSGITEDMLRNQGEKIEDVCNEIIEFVKRNSFNVGRNCQPFLVGQNIMFDIGFLQQILLYTGRWDEFCKLIRGHKDYWGNFQPYYVDTILFAQLALSNNPEYRTWSLGEDSERLGIDLDDAHDADADVIATREIVRILTVRMRNEDVADENGSTVVTKKTKMREHFKI